MPVPEQVRDDSRASPANKALAKKRGLCFLEQIVH